MLDKIDVNAIMLELIKVYGSGFLYSFSIFLIIIGFMFTGFKILRSKGYFMTPLEKSLSDTKTAIVDINKCMAENFSRLADLMTILINSQNSKLDDEQIENIINDKIYIYRKRIMESLMDTYEKNHIKDNKQKTMDKIKENLETIILTEDKIFFKYPNTIGKMIDSSSKMQSLKEENMYDKIYTILIENSGNRSEVKRLISNLFEYFIVKRWVIN